MSLPLCPFSIAPASILSLPSSSLVVNFQSIGANFQQNRAKVNFSLVCFGVFSGSSETTNGESEIYFGFEDCRGFRCGSLFGAVVVSTGWQVVRSCSLSLGVFRPFALPLSLSCFAFQICLISRFKGVFRGFYGAYVCLYGLRSLR